MDFEEEYRRLRRLVLRSFMLVFVVLIAIAFWGSIWSRNLRDQLIATTATVRSLESRIDAKPANYPTLTVQGPTGQNGANGSNAVSTDTLTLQPTYTNVPVPGPVGPQGPKGDQGEAGKPGVAVYIDLTNNICRFAGDTIWQPLAECGDAISSSD